MERNRTNLSNATRAIAPTLSPFVYWSQTKYTLLLKVDLNYAQNVVADFTSKSLTFSAIGHGACGRNEYMFKLRFYQPIDVETATFTETDHNVVLLIRKTEPAWWVRLISTPQKPHWLRVDFDRWRTEDDGEPNEPPRDVREDYEQEYNNLQKQEIGYVREPGKTVYLVLYNIAMFVGYMYISMIIVVVAIRDYPAPTSNTYEYVGNSLKFVQLWQYMDVMHPLFGFTKGSPLVSFFKVSGRNFILFFMIDMEPRLYTEPVVTTLFLIWVIVELARYPFYICQLLKRENAILTWVRYTIWIPLYPMGISSEIIILLRSIPFLEETKRFSIDMPNTWNMSFDMVLFVKVYMLLLALPGSILVMTHMFKLRAKKLGAGRYKIE